MTTPKVIYIKDGKKGKVPYYYWDEYNTPEEAKMIAKKIKEERKGEFNIKYYLMESQDSWFLPVTKYVIYLSKKLRII